MNPLRVVLGIRVALFIYVELVLFIRVRIGRSYSICAWDSSSDDGTVSWGQVF